jgi:hypothetical protein
LPNIPLPISPESLRPGKAVVKGMIVRGIILPSLLPIPLTIIPLTHLLKKSKNWGGGGTELGAEFVSLLRGIVPFCPF